jgi:hypothetical protein
MLKKTFFLFIISLTTIFLFSCATPQGGYIYYPKNVKNVKYKNEISYVGQSVDNNDLGEYKEKNGIKNDGFDYPTEGKVREKSNEVNLILNYLIPDLASFGL